MQQFLTPTLLACALALTSCSSKQSEAEIAAPDAEPPANTEVTEAPEVEAPETPEPAAETVADTRPEVRYYLIADT